MLTLDAMSPRDGMTAASLVEETDAALMATADAGTSEAEIVWLADAMQAHDTAPPMGLQSGLRDLDQMLCGFIERFYNPRRRHSTIGYISPMQFEQQAMEA